MTKSIFCFFIFSHFLIGCQNKTVDSIPKLLPSAEQLSSRVAVSRSVDENSEDVLIAIKALQNNIAKIRSLFDVNGRSYKPFDLLSRIITDFKFGIPEQLDEDTYQAENDMDLSTFDESSDSECNAHTVTASATNVKNSEQEIIGQKLVYSIKNCETDGEAIVIFELEWTKNSINFEIHGDNIKKLFNDNIYAIVAASTSCVLKGSIFTSSAFECSNITVPLNTEQKYLFIEKIKFNPDAFLFLEISGLVVSTSDSTLDSTTDPINNEVFVRLYKEGDPDYEITPLTETLLTEEKVQKLDQLIRRLRGLE